MDTDTDLDADAVLETVRDDRETELSRLGSSKSLYALTEGAMDRDPVLSAMADAAAAAADVYGEWAGDDPDDRAVETFGAIAEADADRHETIAGKLGDYTVGDPPSSYEYLAGLDGTHARVGGLLGETLVTDARLSQAVGFFVGDADPQTASTFREQGATVDDRLGTVTDLLDAVCETDEEYETAREAADAAVGAAYDGYVEALESMGINPKPVC